MRTTIVLLAISMTLVGLPLAAADEGAPDCEADQPLIGYSNTLFLRDILVGQGLADNLYVCEGEHWDGQDTVQEDETVTCNPSASAVPDDLFVGMCEGSDLGAPSQPGADYVGVRLGSSGLSEVYSGTNLGVLGRVGLYLELPTDGSGSASVYLHDNTPNNLLAQVVSAARITQGYPSENDCDQATYQNGAFNPPSQCGRDNTAITVVYALP